MRARRRGRRWERREPELLPARVSSEAMEVVVALPLSDKDCDTVARRLGKEFWVRDIREPSARPQVVLAPPLSPQAIAALKRAYPGAAVVVVELDDWFDGIRVPGPVTRALEAGADAYYVANSSESLADLLRRLPRPESTPEELGTLRPAQLEAAAPDCVQRLTSRPAAGAERGEAR